MKALYYWKEVELDKHNESWNLQDLLYAKNNPQNIRVDWIIIETKERFECLLKDDNLQIINSD